MYEYMYIVVLKQQEESISAYAKHLYVHMCIKGCIAQPELSCSSINITASRH